MGEGMRGAASDRGRSGGGTRDRPAGGVGAKHVGEVLPPRARHQRLTRRRFVWLSIVGRRATLPVSVAAQALPASRGGALGGGAYVHAPPRGPRDARLRPGGI